jgi:4'-phosphopantetheinyl transferase
MILEGSSRSWPVPPPLGADEIHLWLSDMSGQAGAPGADRSWLSDAELGRAERFRFERDRRAWLFRQGFLRGVLAGYVGAHPGALAFQETAKGKPRLAPSPGGDGSAPAASILSFNLSHSEGWVLVAVARREVGVDIQAHRPLRDLQGMAERVFSARELRQYAELADERRVDGFYRLWARKEAALKALGEGFHLEPRELDLGLELRPSETPWVPEQDERIARFGSVADLHAPHGCSAALCASGTSWRPVRLG